MKHKLFRKKMIEQKRLEEEWSRREEELTERMAKAVVDSETEESTLPFRKRRNSLDLPPPSLSGGTPAPSEAGSSVWDSHTALKLSSRKVSWWLKRSKPESSASPGFGTRSSVVSEAEEPDRVTLEEDCKIERKQESFEEEWSRREEELIEWMLEAVVDSETEGSTLPFRRRRNSLDLPPPSLSGGTPAPSEAGSSVWDYQSAHEVSSKKLSWWLKRSKAESSASPGFGTRSSVVSEAEEPDRVTLEEDSKIERKQESFEEEWSRREEELIEWMLEAVVDSETEGSTLPFRRRRNSLDLPPPSLSEGTPAPSEAGSSVWDYQSAHEVSSRKGSRLQKRSNPQSSASSGYGTRSSVVSEAEEPDRVTLEEDSVGDTPN
ncbi:uncharacterized protein LOC118216858 [Anguilla anguilla]|uniref:uncharacterized protein LOC118216858 n=1 Tax=Anguilla anguilla TaxID=7936 RepID=UPI0015A76B88|nr:uncharacterized protein LOC118216858 [Anguilla anguilla]